MDLEFREIEDTRIQNAVVKLRSSMIEDLENLSELHSSYSKLLRISNQFCEFITAHDVKSSIFSILMVIAADSCKTPIEERYKIVDDFPYIEFKCEVLSEHSVDVLRIWNDFMFYLPKASKQLENLLDQLEAISNMIKLSAPTETDKAKNMKNFELVLKCIETLKINQNRVKTMEQTVKDYTTVLKKNQYLEQMSKISSIMSSCAGYGIENLMSIFSISSINKYPLV